MERGRNFDPIIPGRQEQLPGKGGPHLEIGFKRRGAVADDDYLLFSGFQQVGAWPLAPFSVPLISGFAPASAAQGTPLTIYGSNFGTSPGTVSLGGAQVPLANITSWSASSIVLTVPASGAPGVIIVSASGVTATSPSQFQYIPADFTVSSPSPSTVTAYPTGAASGSFTKTISGANFSGTISLSYIVPSQISGSLILSIPSVLPGPGTFTGTAAAAYGAQQGTYNVIITASGVKSDGTQATHQFQVPVT